MKKVSLFLVLMIFSQASFASNGLKEALDEYHYNITVEWNQTDEKKLREYDQKLANTIEALISQGQGPEKLIQDVLLISEDKQFNDEMNEILFVHKTNQISRTELINILKEKSSSLHSQGASWHPAVKVILGVVGAYVILKAIMFTIYFWDTEKTDCSVQDCSPPPKPEY